MILHIFNNQKKFSVKYFQFLKDYGIDFFTQKLFHYGKRVEYFDTIPDLEVKYSRTFINILPHLWLYKKMKVADRIIVHSLASPWLLLFLLNKDLAKKTYWVIWGKDLYFYKNVSGRNPIFKMYECLRKKVIKKIGHIVTNLDGDYDLAVKWYDAGGKREDFSHMLYTYSIDSTIEQNVNSISNTDCLKIILGNSASITNMHIEALEKLKTVDDGKFLIISPLSYGGKKKYVKKVIKRGKELFGDRFKPLCDFVPYDEYMRILENINIGFFYHNRQEAMDSIVSLIAKGKTVYMRSDITPWNYFKNNGIEMKDSLNINGKLVVHTEDVLKNNQKSVCNIHDNAISFKEWEKILK